MPHLPLDRGLLQPHFSSQDLGLSPWRLRVVAVYLSAHLSVGTRGLSASRCSQQLWKGVLVHFMSMG